MIVHLDVKIKHKCKKCNGTGEVLKDQEFSSNIKYHSYKNKFFTYMCTNCDGNGYTWKKRTINLKQLKGILDEED